MSDDLDPERWARRFLDAYATVDADAVRTDTQRLVFVTGWFRSAMQIAATKAEQAWVELAARRDRDTT